MRAGRSTVGAAAGLVLVSLAASGSLLSPPSYDPRPVAAHQIYHGLPAQPAGEGTAVRADLPIRSEEVRVSVRGGIGLPATVVSPATPGRYPALVFVQGSGRADRGEFVTQARHLAASGVVTLVYDKRSEGYSFRNRDFGLLADDALAAVQVLRARPDVDPARTGLWGVSEGTWVVPVAAAKSRDVGFTVMVSAPNVTPLRQVAWALNRQLDRLHAPSGVYNLLDKGMGAVGLGFLHYDSTPWLRRIKQPVLALYGTDDPSIPFVESTRVLENSLRQAGNENYTIRFFPGADHAMRINGGEFTPRYLGTLAGWIRGLPDTARPAAGEQIAGATPVQRYAVADVPVAPWYAGGAVLGLALCMAGIGYVAGPVAAVVTRLRNHDMLIPVETGQQRWNTIRPRLGRLTMTVFGLLAAVTALFTMLVLFAVNQAGAWPAVLAGWLVVRTLAVLLLLQQVTTVAEIVRNVRDGWHPTRWQRLTVVGITGGAGLLLFAAAYYGLFAIPW
ncbi:alpha/beta hydrolase family protein [Rhizohabitans arisaemae]|uniref:alpha/beta hydrolase family protein n=1 Tax=Rhizohabitans arisaemae TaxID=2720610 RepID=UPI0024B0557C|nr:prolyl oligopeptidase family serine peptidase [Rhizohabitans arisaemae]